MGRAKIPRTPVGAADARRMGHRLPTGPARSDSSTGCPERTASRHGPSPTLTCSVCNTAARLAALRDTADRLVQH